ncbi:MAG: hypothetical protein NT056_06440 [Proteobacteria bacterium]|nr:hypothetical protein [Pseudomonadota bacterium]
MDKREKITNLILLIGSLLAVLIWIPRFLHAEILTVNSSAATVIELNESGEITSQEELAGDTVLIADLIDTEEPAGGNNLALQDSLNNLADPAVQSQVGKIWADNVKTKVKTLDTLLAKWIEANSSEVVARDNHEPLPQGLYSMNMDPQ